MSRTTLYSVTSSSCVEIGETKNAWRSAMYVWDNIAQKYFDLERFPHFDEEMQRRVWNAGNEHQLTDSERIVLASTMDYVTVKKSDIHRLIDAFETYALSHPNSSIGEQAALLKSVELSDNEVVAWNQTSVSEFLFEPQWCEKTDLETYNDLSNAWDLFEQFDLLAKETN